MIMFNVLGESPLTLRFGVDQGFGYGKGGK